MMEIFYLFSYLLCDWTGKWLTKSGVICQENSHSNTAGQCSPIILSILFEILWDSLLNVECARRIDWEVRKFFRKKTIEDEHSLPADLRFRSIPGVLIFFAIVSTPNVFEPFGVQDSMQPWVLLDLKLWTKVISVWITSFQINKYKFLNARTEFNERVYWCDSTSAFSELTKVVHRTYAHQPDKNENELSWSVFLP